MVVAGVVVISCSASSETSSASSATPRTTRHRRAEISSRPIAADHLDSELELRNAVLTMPFGEVAARLGSLRFEATSRMRFSQGSRQLEQTDRYSTHRDDRGNFHTVVETQQGRVEVIGIDDDFFVRQNQGHFRRKPNREVQSQERWEELAWSSFRGAFEPFFGRLVLETGRRETLNGRRSLRYRLRLARDASTPGPVRLRGGALASPPPSIWREHAEALALQGDVWVDDETAVVLKADFEGRLQLGDQGLSRRELTLSYQGAVVAIGAAPRVEAPKRSLAEFGRQARPADRLSFFRDRIPLPKSAERRADGQRP